jgi:hypothetical protein
VQHFLQHKASNRGYQAHPVHGRTMPFTWGFGCLPWPRGTPGRSRAGTDCHRIRGERWQRQAVADVELDISGDCSPFGVDVPAAGLRKDEHALGSSPTPSNHANPNRTASPGKMYAPHSLMWRGRQPLTYESASAMVRTRSPSAAASTYARSWLSTPTYIAPFSHQFAYQARPILAMLADRPS